MYFYDLFIFHVFINVSIKGCKLVWEVDGGFPS